MKRKIEIFTAGCPVCSPVVQLIREVACKNCDVAIYNLTEEDADRKYSTMLDHYGIKQLPAVVVNGELLQCCKGERITKEDLIVAGIGQG